MRKQCQSTNVAKFVEKFAHNVKVWTDFGPLLFQLCNDLVV